MPLYEYQCGPCGRFERIQKFSDPPLTACPTCGGEIEKLLSSPAIQFKGTGWYVTDYARKGSGGEGKSEGKKDGGSGKSSSDGPSGSSDSKSTSKEGSSSSSTSASKDTPSGGGTSTK